MRSLNPVFPFPCLGVLGIGLALVGSRMSWLELPLSGPLPAMALGVSLPGLGPVTLSDLFLVATLVTGLGWLGGFRFLTLFGAVAAFAILAWFVVHVSIQEHHWLVHYLIESEQRSELQHFLKDHYWPNPNPDPTTVLVGKFEYLPERLILFWGMVHEGWVLAALGTALLLLNCALSTPATRLLTLTAMAAVMVVVAVATVPVVDAEISHRRGDALLGSGQPRDAITAYEAALRSDPVLQYSKPFLLKASHAFYRVEGKHSSLARLYLASTNTEDLVGGRLTTAQRLEEARFALTEAIHAFHDGSPLQRAILQQTILENIRIRVTEGLLAYKNGELSGGLAAFQMALQGDRSQVHTQFFLAHVLRELGIFKDSTATLESALRALDNKPLRADLFCTIGDAYLGLGDALQARKAYQTCFDLDLVYNPLYNYRAVQSLGGT